jgi:ubiquinol-cytochrome c reductase iron-sulfur subunit
VDKNGFWRQKQTSQPATASQRTAKIAGCFGVEGEPRVRDDTLPQPARRDILFVATGAMATVAVGAAVWPLIQQMNPDASTRALASTDVDLSGIAPGQIVTVKWRGKPVFIRHRTPAEIGAAEKTPLNVLPDPQPDSARVKKPEWLVVIGVCTHLGCIPLGHEGEFGGWFCPCHGSTYDVSGRIRSGPAPANLEVPEYSFLSDTKIKIG